MFSGLLLGLMGTSLPAYGQSAGDLALSGRIGTGGMPMLGVGCRPAEPLLARFFAGYAQSEGFDYPDCPPNAYCPPIGHSVREYAAELSAIAPFVAWGPVVAGAGMEAGYSLWHAPRRYENVADREYMEHLLTGGVDETSHGWSLGVLVHLSTDVPGRLTVFVESCLGVESGISESHEARVSRLDRRELEWGFSEAGGGVSVRF